MRFTSQRRWRAAGITVSAALLAATTVSMSPVSASETEIQSSPGIVADVQSPASNAALIKRLYRTVLGRNAEPGGLKYWLEQMADGLTYDQVVAEFLNSAEWQAAQGTNVSDADYVEFLYENGLGRASDPDGKAYWLKVLDNGIDRSKLVVFFAESQEQHNNTEQGSDFTLDIFHINDHHSHLQEDKISLDYGDIRAQSKMGGFPRVVAAIDQFRAASTADATAAVHAGDAMTGTLFYTLFKGKADAALMNEVCFDVFALGNHEFDGSDDGLAFFLDELAKGDCNTPALAANVKPAIGTPLAPVNQDDYIRPFVVKQYGDQQVGYIGIDIKQKTQVSSSPLDSTEFFDEVETAQKYIDILTDMGVDKIIVVTHQTYASDLRMAAALSGVDVIVGGDSHSLIGNFADAGLASEGVYPTKVTDKTGLDVCVVQAWQYSSVVGELNIAFDQYGEINECGGTAHLLLGDSFKIKDANGDRQPATAEQDAAINAIIAADPELLIVAPDADAQAVVDSFSGELDTLSQGVVGQASELLCLARIPGDNGQSTSPDCTAAAVAHGGDIQQLVTYAFADRAFDADIGLQNSGGVRVDVLPGEYTIGDAYTLLPFSNTIYNLDMTGTEIKATLEDALTNIIDNGGSSGSYPYGAYVRWDVDMTAASGNRISNMEFRAKGTTEWVAFDMARTYKVAANSYISNGRDGYDTMKTVVDDGRSVDTAIDYAQGFIDYIEQDLNGTFGKVPISDYSTQGFIPLP